MELRKLSVLPRDSLSVSNLPYDFYCISWDIVQTIKCQHHCFVFLVEKQSQESNFRKAISEPPLANYQL